MELEFFSCVRTGAAAVLMLASAPHCPSSWRPRGAGMIHLRRLAQIWSFSKATAGVGADASSCCQWTYDASSHQWSKRGIAFTWGAVLRKARIALLVGPYSECPESQRWLERQRAV